jgi:hypothetical protein
MLPTLANTCIRQQCYLSVRFSVVMDRVGSGAFRPLTRKTCCHNQHLYHSYVRALPWKPSSSAFVRLRAVETSTVRMDRLQQFPEVSCLQFPLPCYACREPGGRWAYRRTGVADPGRSHGKQVQYQTAAKFLLNGRLSHWLFNYHISTAKANYYQWHLETGGVGPAGGPNRIRLLDLLFDPEDGGSIFLRNFGKLLPDYWLHIPEDSITQSRKRWNQ